jgi:protein-S-isoprenylcysteine O-methyltransferase Ste14
MWAVILLGIVVAFLFLPYGFLYAPSTISIILFTLAFLYWMYFFLKGVAINVQAPMRPQHIHHIVVKGVYNIVRHPMYSGDIILAWGIAIAYPLLILWVCALWFTMIMVLWAHIEEQILTKRFGEEYREYKKRVPMWIPRLNTKRKATQI